MDFPRQRGQHPWVVRGAAVILPASSLYGKLQILTHFLPCDWRGQEALRSPALWLGYRERKL